MQLKSISLAVLTTLLANGTILIGWHLPVLSQSTQVLAQRADTRKEEADKLIELGNGQLDTSQFEAALRSYQQALKIYQSIKNRLGESNALGGLGLAYNSLGDYKQAIDYQLQSLAIARQIKDRLGEGQSLGNLGNAYYSLGDYKQAIDYQLQSLGIARQIKNRLGEGQSLGNLGVAYDSLGDYKQAIDYDKQFLAIARQIKNRLGEGESLGNLGLAYNSLGDYKQAIDYDKQYLAIARQIKNRLGEGIALNNLGFTLLNTDNPKSAQINLQNAIQVWEAMRADLNNDAFKVSIFETQANTYRLLQQALIAQNQTTQALEIAERGRTRALTELLAQRQQLLSTSPKIQDIQKIAHQQNATLVEYSIVWDDLYIWVVKPTGKVTFRKVDLKKTPLANVAEDARTAAATLALAPQERGIATNLINSLVGSTRAALVQSSDNPPTANTTNPPRTLSCRGNNCLQQMYKLLIQPIATELPTNPNSRIIFIPHESLFLVPFPALQDPTNQKFLIEQHTISIAPSIQILQLTHARKLQLQQSNSLALALGANISPTALVVGNPTMPKIGNPPQQLQPLPAAEQEAKDIAQTIFKTQALIGQQATKANVLQQMLTATIIHLATHGLFDELTEPGIPGILALAPSGKDNGLLTANEVLQLNLNAQLVVLSACDTGRGRITGDGVIGLSRAFISAGTPSVIVSLWSVGDGSTASLMPEFYRQLQYNPTNKASALRQAILNTMKNYPNPRDWAAFLLIGES